MRSSDIWEGLQLELLFLCNERSQLRWFVHLCPASQMRYSRHCPTGRRPPCRPRTCWRDDISLLAWCSPRRAGGGGGWGEGGLGLSAGTAALITQIQISSRKGMDGWMDMNSLFQCYWMRCLSSKHCSDFFYSVLQDSSPDHNHKPIPVHFCICSEHIICSVSIMYSHSFTSLQRTSVRGTHPHQQLRQEQPALERLMVKMELLKTPFTTPI